MIIKGNFDLNFILMIKLLPLINKTSLLIDSQNPLSSNLGIILALYSYHKRIIDPKFNSSQASKNLLKDSSNILVLKK
ncbi:hypothetical protein, partial [Thomasclavelia cocleata]|uniref:hypothetical protein n=1 Tax=Thomasclavelia cocleata TaxID=69824 RepID=UPI00272E2DC7